MRKVKGSDKTKNGRGIKAVLRKSARLLLLGGGLVLGFGWLLFGCGEESATPGPNPNPAQSPGSPVTAPASPPTVAVVSGLAPTTGGAPSTGPVGPSPTNQAAASPSTSPTVEGRADKEGLKTGEDYYQAAYRL